MKGISEPFTKFYGLFIWILIATAFSTGFFWIGEIDSALIDEYGAKGVNKLALNGYIDKVIAGLPQWAFNSIICLSVAILLAQVSVSMWDTDSDKEECDVVSNGNTSLFDNDGVSQDGQFEMSCLNGEDKE